MKENNDAMIFEKSAQYYNQLYEQKDYSGEVDYIVNLIRKFKPEAVTLLDVGCGTGTHSSFLAEKGYQVEGLDLSDEMLSEAAKRYPAISFHQGDARHFDLGKKFDILTSLFHVASYQVENQDLLNYFHSARLHLEDDGLFIFDFWYGPGVLTDPPSVRVKRIQTDEVSLVRVAEPQMDVSRDVVNVKYELLIHDIKDNSFRSAVENHYVRYLFVPELNLFLENSGFEMLSVSKWLSLEKPTHLDWYACIVARARAGK